MDVILSPDRFDLQEVDLLVSGFFEDERPLRGPCGWIDWRLNGRLSRFLVSGRVTGTWQETLLLSSDGRMAPRMILLVGLGPCREYSTLRLRDLFPFLFRTIQKMRPTALCLSFPCEAAGPVDCGKFAEILLEGIGDGLDSAGAGLDETWVQGLRLHLAEGAVHFPELLVGVETARALFRSHLEIRILTPALGETDLAPA
jgi:hypothetical protein